MVHCSSERLANVLNEEQQVQRIRWGWGKAVVGVEAGRCLVFGMHQNGPDADSVRGGEAAQEGVSQQFFRSCRFEHGILSEKLVEGWNLSWRGVQGGVELGPFVGGQDVARAVGKRYFSGSPRAVEHELRQLLVLKLGGLDQRGFYTSIHPQVDARGPGRT